MISGKRSYILVSNLSSDTHRKYKILLKLTMLVYFCNWIMKSILSTSALPMRTLLCQLSRATILHYAPWLCRNMKCVQKD